MKAVILSLLFVMGVNSVHAEETMGEKGAKTGHTIKRKVKKMGHRVEEAVCAKSDAKCLAEKAGNRMEEGADYVKDKAVETKDKVD
jgi:hypothetical protein